MKPATAHVVMTVALLLFVIAGMFVVNSWYGGSFVAGQMIIGIPFLLLAHLIPHLLPVSCPGCGARMRFKRSQFPLRE